MTLKNFSVIFITIIVMGLALPRLAAAATLPTITMIPVSNAAWTDETGYTLAIAGFSPAIADYVIKGGSEDAYITSLSFKVSNPDFVPSIDKFYLVYNNPNKPTIYKELTLANDGTVATGANQISILIPKNKSNDFAISMLMKKNAGGLPSGITTTIALDIDEEALSLTSDFKMKTKSGRKINGEMISASKLISPVFVLRYAVATIRDACQIISFDCTEDFDPSEPTIARYYFGSEISRWENPNPVKPMLNSFKFNLSGDAIKSGAGDNQVKITVYTSNYPAPIKLGEAIVSNVDAGKSATAELVLSSPLPFPGSQLVWLNVPKSDDDIDSDKEIKLNIVSFNWSDGSAASLTNSNGAQGRGVAAGAAANRPKFDMQFKQRTIAGVRSAVITAAITSKTPLHSIDIYVGQSDTKDRLGRVKHCNGNSSGGVARCEFTKPLRLLKGGYAFTRVQDDNNVVSESALYYFTL